MIYQIIENGIPLDLCGRTESEVQKWIVLKAKQFMKENGVKYKENQDRIYFRGEKDVPNRAGMFLFFKNPGRYAHTELDVCTFSEVRPWFGAPYMKEESVCYTIKYHPLDIVSFNIFPDDIYSEEFTKAPTRQIYVPKTEIGTKVLTQIKTGNLKSQLKKTPPAPPPLPVFNEPIPEEKIKEINEFFIIKEEPKTKCHVCNQSIE